LFPSLVDEPDTHPLKSINELRASNNKKILANLLGLSLSLSELLNLNYS